MKNFLKFLIAAGITLSVLFPISTTADVINTLDQFTATTSPITAITQRVYGKALIITGLTNGLSLCLDSNGKVTTSGCSSAVGGSGTFSTTTSTVTGQFINYPNNNTDIVTIGSTATSTSKFYLDPNTKTFITGSATKVGIGEPSPITPLEIRQTSTGSGVSGTSGTGAIRNSFSTGYGVGIDTWDSGTPRWGVLNFNQDTPTVMMEGAYNSTDVQFNAGNVGIGTTSPKFNLGVRGNLGVNNIYATNLFATGTVASIFPYASSTAATATKFFSTNASITYASSTYITAVMASTSQAIFAGGPWVDARSCGAVGDGVTDDSTAINNCITDLSTNKGGGKLYISAAPTRSATTKYSICAGSIIMKPYIDVEVQRGVEIQVCNGFATSTVTFPSNTNGTYFAHWKGGTFSEAGVGQKLWTAFNVESQNINGGVFWNTISDVIINLPSVCIRSSVIGGASGWLNSNTYRDIVCNDPTNAWTFNDDRTGAFVIDETLFDNVQVQSNTSTETCFGDLKAWNTQLINAFCYDMNATSTSMSINSASLSTLIEGGFVTNNNFVNNGVRTTIIGDRLYPFYATSTSGSMYINTAGQTMFGTTSANFANELVSVADGAINLGISTVTKNSRLEFFRAGSADTQQEYMKANSLVSGNPNSGSVTLSVRESDAINIDSDGTSNAAFFAIRNNKATADILTTNEIFKVMENATNGYAVGIGTSSPYAPLSVVGQTVSAYFTATTSTSSVFPYASTTALSGGTFCLDTCITSWPSAGAGTYPFVPATTYNTISSGTSTPLWLQGTPYSFFASSTSVFNYASVTNMLSATQASSTNQTVDLSLGVGTTTPWASLSVLQRGTTPPLIIATTTGSVNSYGPALFVDANGKVDIGTSTSATFGTQALNVAGNILLSNSNVGGLNGRIILIYGGTTDNLQDYLGSAAGNSGTIGASTRQAFVINIDSDNNSSSNAFAVRHDKTAIDALTTSELFRVDELGHVAISTSTPFAALQVATTSTNAGGFVPQIALTDNGAGANLKHWTITNTQGILYISTTTDVYASSTPSAVTILNNGAFLIGSSTNATLGLGGLGISQKFFAPNLTNSNAGDYICFNTTTGEVEQNATACSLSSIRWKQNVKDLTYGLDQVLKLRPVFYDLKPQYGTAKNQPGFIAEEAIKEVPSLVSIDTEGKPTGFDYPKLTAVLTKAIQDFYKQFQALVARVSGVENRINAQQKQIDELKSEINLLKNK